MRLKRIIALLLIAALAFPAAAASPEQPAFDEGIYEELQSWWEDMPLSELLAHFSAFAGLMFWFSSLVDELRLQLEEEGILPLIRELLDFDFQRWRHFFDESPHGTFSI